MCRRIVKLEMHLEKLLFFMVIANRQSQKSYLHGEVRVIRSSLIAVHSILCSEQMTFTIIWQSRGKMKIMILFKKKRKTELNSSSHTNLFECSLGEQVTFDSWQGFMRVVISLFYQSKFFSLWLVQPALDTVSFLESLQCENEQLSVMLVWERREWYWRESSTLQPMYCSCVDGDSFFCCDVWPILQIIYSYIWTKASTYTQMNARTLKC